MKKELTSELKKYFKPEFINRMDDTIVFRPISKEDLVQIAEVELKKLYARIAKQYEGMKVDLTDAFKKKLLDVGYNPEMGARPLRRAITTLVQDELSTSVMAHPPGPNELVIMDVGPDGKVIVERPDGKSTERETVST